MEDEFERMHSLFYNIVGFYMVLFSYSDFKIFKAMLVTSVMGANLQKEKAKAEEKEKERALFQARVEICFDDFVQHHCIFGDDDITHGDEFFGAFLQLFYKRYPDYREWGIGPRYLPRIFQNRCYRMQFSTIGHAVSRQTIIVVGVRLKNLQQLWPRVSEDKTSLNSLPGCA